MEINKNYYIAYCGLDCLKCEARIATINNDDNLRNEVAKKWSLWNNTNITPDMINCVGCKIDGIKTPFCQSLCQIRQCALKNNIDSCGKCNQIKKCNKIKMIIDNNEQARKNLKIG